MVMPSNLKEDYYRECLNKKNLKIYSEHDLSFLYDEKEEGIKPIKDIFESTLKS